MYFILIIVCCSVFQIIYHRLNLSNSSVLQLQDVLEEVILWNVILLMASLLKYIVFIYLSNQTYGTNRHKDQLAFYFSKSS